MLQGGVAVGVALAVGGVGLAVRGTVVRAPRRPLRALDLTSYSVLAAAADRLAPTGPGWPTAAELEVAEKIDDLLSRGDPATAAELVQVLSLLENALLALLLGGRLTTFTGSGIDCQDAALNAWRRSRLPLLRTAFKALNGLVGASYFGDPRTFALVGYPGPPDYSGYVPAPEAVGATEAPAPSEGTP